MQSDESLRDELLADVEAVAPILTEHAPQSEKLGRLNEPTIEALRKTRLLRFACPRELGGYEADPITALEVLEAVARIDGSAGWTLGILALTSAIAGAFLPGETARRIFAAGIPPMAGMIAPKGTAEPVDGGYRVTGCWAFGSGIHHADWVIAGAFLPGQPSPGAGIRMVLLPRGQVMIHDNWQVAGLKASGSCDYSIENVFVPDEMTFSCGRATRECRHGWCRTSPRTSGIRHVVPYGNRPRYRASRLRRDHRAGDRERPRLPTVAASYPSTLPVCPGKGRVAARIGACAGAPGSVARLDRSTGAAGSATADASGGACGCRVHHRGGAAGDHRRLPSRGRRRAVRYQPAAALLL
jgi:hypothetical protein